MSSAASASSKATGITTTPSRRNCQADTSTPSRRMAVSQRIVASEPVTDRLGTKIDGNGDRALDEDVDGNGGCHIDRRSGNQSHRQVVDQVACDGNRATGAEGRPDHRPLRRRLQQHYPERMHDAGLGRVPARVRTRRPPAAGRPMKRLSAVPTGPRACRRARWRPPGWSPAGSAAPAACRETTQPTAPPQPRGCRSRWSHRHATALECRCPTRSIRAIRRVAGSVAWRSCRDRENRGQCKQSDPLQQWRHLRAENHQVREVGYRQHEARGVGDEGAHEQVRKRLGARLFRSRIDGRGQHHGGGVVRHEDGDQRADHVRQQEKTPGEPAARRTASAAR